MAAINARLHNRALHERRTFWRVPEVVSYIEVGKKQGTSYFPVLGVTLMRRRKKFISVIYIGRRDMPQHGYGEADTKNKAIDAALKNVRVELYGHPTKHPSEFPVSWHKRFFLEETNDRGVDNSLIAVGLEARHGFWKNYYFKKDGVTTLVKNMPDWS